MSNENNDLNARATYGGYLALCSIWGILALSYIALAISKQALDAFYVALLCIFVGLLFFFWLTGHRIIISNEKIIYRDGFFRKRECLLSDIKSLKHAWVHYQYLWRKLEMPRLVIRFHDRKAPPILINAKPFSRDDLMKLEKIVKNYQIKK